MVQLDRLPVSSRDPPVSTPPEPGRKKKGRREGRREEGCSGGNVKANFQLIKRRILLQFELSNHRWGVLGREGSLLEGVCAPVRVATRQHSKGKAPNQLDTE